MDKTENQEVALSNNQAKYLRGLGHKLSPVILIGKEDISESVLEAIRVELARHELVKVKIGTNSAVDKKEAARLVPAATDSQLVQFIGKTLLLYKANPQKPKENRIHLPR